METKHTQGPWALDMTEISSGEVYVRNSAGRMLAQVAQPLLAPGSVEDTARLISAAPEMADALVETCATCESSVCGGCSVGRALHKAGVSLELWDGLEVDE